MTKNDDEQLLLAIRESLDAGVARLPPATTARLDAIRQRAITGIAHASAATGPDQALVEEIRAQLGRGLAALDPAVRERLDGMRSRAVGRVAGGRNPGRLQDRLAALAERFRIRLSIPATSLATACLLVAVVTLALRSPGEAIPTHDAEVLLFASQDEIELYENLEFYLWLAENELSN